MDKTKNNFNWIKKNNGALIFVAFLFVFWIIFSGKINLLFLSLGAFSTAIITITVTSMLKIPFHIFLLPPLKTAKYIFWLIYQVILSSWGVTKNILSFQKNKTKSKIITINDEYNDDFLTTIFANSVTLTPGTATIFIENNKLPRNSSNNRNTKKHTDNKGQKTINSEEDSDKIYNRISMHILDETLEEGVHEIYNKVKEEFQK